jgi:tape measure domain-containing protein
MVRGAEKGERALDSLGDKATEVTKDFDKIDRAVKDTGRTIDQSITDGARKSERSLEGLGDAAEDAQRQFNDINETINKFDTDKITRESASGEDALERLGSSADKASSKISGLGGSADRFDGKTVRDGATSAGRGIKNLGDDARKTESQFNSLNDSIDNFEDILSGLFIAGIVREFARLLDVTSKIDSNINLVVKSTDELSAVYDELLRVSNKTFSSLEDNAEVFNRLSVATKDLGLTYGEVIGITEDLNKLLKINGATAAETNSVMIQLAQGLGAGALQGDEFRAIAEALPQVLDLVTDELNRTSGGAKITRGELKKLASEGKVTAEVVINAFKNASDDINKQFQNITPTIEGAFTVLKNNLVNFVRDTNRATGIASGFSNAILLVANNVEGLAGAVFGLTTVLAAKLARSLAIATKALLATPIGRIAALFVTATTALGAFGDKSVMVGGETATIWQVVSATFATVGDIVEKVTGKFKQLFDSIKDSDFVKGLKEGFEKAGAAIVDVFRGILSAYKRTYNNIINGAKAAVVAIKGFFGILPDAFKLIFQQAANNVISKMQTMAKAVGGIFNLIPEEIRKALGIDDVTDKMVGDFTSGLDKLKFNTGQTVQDIQDEFTGIKLDIGKTFETDNFEALGKALEGVGDLAVGAGAKIGKIFKGNLEAGTGAAEGAKKATDLLSGAFGTVNTSADSASKKFAEITKGLQEQADILMLTGLESAQLSEQYKVQAQIGRALTDSERELLNSLVATNTTLTVRQDLLNSMQSPMENVKAQIEALNKLFMDGQIPLDQFNAKMKDLQTNALQLKLDQGEGGFSEGFLSSLAKMSQGYNGLSAEIGKTTGDMLSNISNGFADTMGQAIWQSEGLGESLKAVGRDAVSQLVSSLIKVGIQMVANAVLARTLGATNAAASTAEAATVTAAWTPAAVMASIGSFGAAAAIGIGAVLAAKAVGFRDGGFVSGDGTARSDSILARLSDGEFVVNAAATSRNRQTLERMNRGEDIAPRGGVIMNITTKDADSFVKSQNQIIARQTVAQERAVRRSRG